MRCPCCAKELTVGQEFLYSIEDVYYCPLCLVKTTDWPDKAREGEKREKVESVKVESAGPDRLGPATAERVDEKGVV